MIKKEELIEMIENLDLADEELLNYIIEDEDHSEPFNVAFKANPDKVLDLSNADEGLLGFLNKRCRRKRQRKYEKKIKRGFNGIRIVSEGDSWFQYPILLKDIIDNLNGNDKFAIYSLGYGGDWLSNIYREQEYLKALREKQPKVFLLSGGGNDLAGNNRIATMVHYFDSNKKPEEYLNEESERFFNDMKVLYNKIFINITTEFPDIKIVCHGYDYAIPDKGKWLGEPLKSRGIDSADLQREIIKVFMDKFNNILSEFEIKFNNVFFADLRGTIIESTGWHNELHPNNWYFEKVSEKIESKIFEALEKSSNRIEA